MARQDLDLAALSARSRQVLDTLYRLGEASAGELLDETPDVPSYSAIRSILRQLLDKGYIARFERNLRYVYHPVVPKSELSQSVLTHVLETFFDRSPQVTMSALIDVSRREGYDIDWDELERLIRQAKKEHR